MSRTSLLRALRKRPVIEATPVKKGGPAPFPGSAQLRHVDTGSCNGCEVEIAQAFAPMCDAGRLGHGLAKAVLFLASGEILLVEGTSEIAKVPSLLVRRPLLGGIFGFGLLALLGLPPFSLFVSELNMIRGELSVGLGWAVAVSLVAMAVIFAVVMSHGRHLLLGGDGSAPSPTSALVGIPLTGGLVACAALGLSAWPLQSLLVAAAHIVAR